LLNYIFREKEPKKSKERFQKMEKKENKKTITTRVFSLEQHEYNPKTGESLNFNEDTIKDALAKYKSIKEWAYICHDKDVYTEEEETKGLGKAGELKPKHWHLIARSKRANEIADIAKWFNVPFMAVKKRERTNEFIKGLEYLTHEAPEQQELGKHLYPDTEVVSNFDFRTMINERVEKLLKYGKDLDLKDQILFDIMYCGKTLKEVREEYPLIYMNNTKKFRDARLECISNQDVPNTRLNYYISGMGGYGKDVASRALARSLYPHIKNDEDIFFEVGSKNATFEGYDGQPVIIWSEYRAFTLLEVFGGRENLFKVFDSHPHNSKVNIKFGSVKLINTVNIVNSVQDYTTFLDGLAGEYVDKAGNLFQAEDKGQSYRRFPILIPLYANDIDILFSKYITGESDNPLEYEQWKKVCGNFRKIRMACKNNEELARKLEDKMLVGLPEKSHELLKNETELTEEEILKELEGFGEEIPIIPEPTSTTPGPKKHDLIELAGWDVDWTGTI